jgi:hypothetical protein
MHHVQLITDLPDDFFSNLQAELLSSDKKRLAMLGNKRFYSLFNHHVMPVQQRVTALLECVMQREYEAIKQLLMDDPGLLLEKGVLIDFSGRKFKSISALQYALWALDYEICMLLLPFFDSFNKEAANEQIYAWCTGQQTFFVGHGRHFDYSTLINAIQTYIDHYHDDWSEQEIIDYWCHHVKSVQQQSTVMIAHYYCCDEYKKKKIPYDAIRTYYNPAGISAAIHGYSGAYFIKAPAVSKGAAIYRDLATLKRMQDDALANVERLITERQLEKVICLSLHR